jgi:hypothetical protein
MRGDVLIVSVLAPLLVLGVTEVGLKLHAAPVGSPEQLKFVTAKLYGAGLGVTVML